MLPVLQKRPLSGSIYAHIADQICLLGPDRSGVARATQAHLPPANNRQDDLLLKPDKSCIRAVTRPTPSG